MTTRIDAHGRSVSKIDAKIDAKKAKANADALDKKIADLEHKNDLLRLAYTGILDIIKKKDDQRIALEQRVEYVFGIFDAALARLREAERINNEKVNP